jgi:hypothetical protein
MEKLPLFYARLSLGHLMTFGAAFFFLDWGGMDIKGFSDKTIDIDYHYQYNKVSE